MRQVGIKNELIILREQRIEKKRPITAPARNWRLSAPQTVLPSVPF